MEAETALVAAYELDGKGGGTLLSVRQLREAWADPQRPLWMHLDFRHEDVRTYLVDIAGLDEAPVPHDVSDALAIAVCHAHIASSPLAAARSVGHDGVRSWRQYRPQG